MDEKQTTTPCAPLIGITANRKEGQACVAETYIQAVAQAGGIPVLIPALSDIKLLTDLVSGLDGLLLSGGGDINPLYLHEEPIPQLQDVDPVRDGSELTLLRLASERQLPIMGICRGHQLLNAAFGGTLYQDIYTEAEGSLLKHSQSMAREFPSHTICLESVESQLRRVLGEIERLPVNSFHHQAVRTVAPGFVATATAPDGINEGLEHPEKRIFSVQWHPEAMAAHGDKVMARLFDYLVENARRFATAKAIHSRIVTIDSHTDTPMIFPGHFDIGEKAGGKVNLPFMEEGRIDATFMVAYIPQGERDDAALEKATAYAVERLNEVKRQETLHPDRMRIATSAEEILTCKRTGRKAICLGVENGYAIGKRLENIGMFREMGVLYITLCHNGDNDICDSARGKGEWNGVSPFGREVIREMNRQHVLVDVSHAAESSFYDALALSEYPIIASHSAAYTLCPHPRNLKDAQLKALAEQGGVAQVCLYKGFINPDAEKASLSDAIRHINHIVELVGIDHVGIGSDFDGDGELIGCASTNELINITVRLLEEGYSEEEIGKLWGGNLMRVMRANKR